MKQGTLIEHTWAIIVLIGIVFAVTKFIIIKRHVSMKKSGSIFLLSLLNVSRYTIENTDNKQVKQYFKISNIVNMSFYLLTAVILLTYVFFMYII